VEMTYRKRKALSARAPPSNQHHRDPRPFPLDLSILRAHQAPTFEPLSAAPPESEQQATATREETRR